MQFGEGTKKAAYFSVTYTTDVGQMRCIPQVCYWMNDEVRLAVEKMEQDGLAKIYTEEMRFVSGVAIPMRKPPVQIVPVATGTTSSVGSTNGELSSPGKRGGKKGHKQFE